MSEPSLSDLFADMEAKRALFQEAKTRYLAAERAKAPPAPITLRPLGFRAFSGVQGNPPPKPPEAA